MPTYLRILPSTANATIFLMWNVADELGGREYDEFGSWFVGLGEADHDAIDFTVELLAAQGPSLRFPHSSGIPNSRHSHMRELRLQSEGRPLRIFYAFDPRRAAILLIGGDKTGDDRFYDRLIPIADTLYDVHLEELRQEGSIK